MKRTTKLTKGTKRIPIHALRDLFVLRGFRMLPMPSSVLQTLKMLAPRGLIVACKATGCLGPSRRGQARPR